MKPRSLGRFTGPLGRIVNKAEDLLLLAIFGCMLFFAVLQIVQRNTLGGGPAWNEELLSILVLWLALIGSTAASRDNNHIKIDLVSRYLPGRFRYLLETFAMAFTAVVCAAVSYYCWRFVAGEKDALSQVLGGAPSWPFQLILPLGFAVITLRYAVLCVRAFGLFLHEGEAR